MQLKLQNKYLQPIDQLLFNLNIDKPQESRSRTKLKKLIIRKFEEYQDDQREILKKFAPLDAEGNPKTDNQGNYVMPENQVEFQKEFKILSDEWATIEGGEYVNHIDQVKSVLENLDIPLSGAIADAYDHLLDAYEAASTKTEKEGK